jgi:MFS family permease
MDEKKSYSRFLVLNLSQSISLVGSGLTDFALTYYILHNVMQNGGLISEYTILYFIMYLPGIVVAPFIGALIDRSNKRHVMIGSDTIAAVGSLVILFVYMKGDLQLCHIYGVVFVKAVASAFQTPSFQSSISALVEKKDYGKAVGLAQVGESINKIIAPLAAGILFYYTSMEMIIIIDLVCYLLAMICVVPCKMPELNNKIKSVKGEFLKDCRLGFLIIKEDHLLVSLLALFCLNNFFISIIEILVQPLVYVMNGTGLNNSVALGIVMTCGGVGMMISSIILGVKGGPKNKIAAILLLNACGGVVLTAVIAVNSIVVFAAGTLLYFLTIPFILGSNITIWQERVPIEHQGKVFSIRRACILGISPLSSLIAGGVMDYLKLHYNQLPILHGLVPTLDSIYSFLFFVIGLITLITSVVFKYNKYFKTYQKDWKAEVNYE